MSAELLFVRLEEKIPLSLLWQQGEVVKEQWPAQAQRLEKREPLQKHHLRHPPRARLPWLDQWLLLPWIPLSSHPHQPQSQLSLLMGLEPLPKLLRQQVPLAVDIQEEGEVLGLEIRAFRRSMR